MARGSGGFVAGVVAGSAVVVAALIGLQFLPEQQESVGAARDRLMSQLSAAGDGVERALPKELRTEDCDIASVLDEALSASVKPPIEQGEPGGPYDYDTQELRIDAALGATACRRLGRIGRLDVDRVRSLAVVRRVVGRALGEGQIEAARGWSVRLLALGLDLQGASPSTHGVVGAELAGQGALALVDVALHPSLGAEDAAKALVLAGTLDAGAPSGGWIVDRVATDRMRRGLGGPEINELDAATLEEVTATAATWWGDVTAAIDVPGAEIPPRPTAAVPEQQAVLELLTQDVEPLVTAQRNAAAARIGAVALTAARVRGAEGERCGRPWKDEAPLDPHTGSPAQWDVESCTLTLGEVTWTLPPATR